MLALVYLFSGLRFSCVAIGLQLLPRSTWRNKWLLGLKDWNTVLKVSWRACRGRAASPAIGLGKGDS